MTQLKKLINYNTSMKYPIEQSCSFCQFFWLFIQNKQKGHRKNKLFQETQYMTQLNKVEVFANFFGY